MLAPDSRALLLDALRPPRGCSLDRAVATTFTLDLEAALMVPLAFAGFRFEDEPDPIEVMESLREMSGTIRCLLPGRRDQRQEVAIRSGRAA